MKFLNIFQFFLAFLNFGNFVKFLNIFLKFKLIEKCTKS